MPLKLPGRNKQKTQEIAKNTKTHAITQKTQQDTQKTQKRTKNTRKAQNHENAQTKTPKRKKRVSLSARATFFDDAQSCCCLITREQVYAETRKEKNILLAVKK